MFLNDDEQAKSFIITGSGDDKKIFDKKLSFCYYIIIMHTVGVYVRWVNKTQEEGDDVFYFNFYRTI